MANKGIDITGASGSPILPVLPGKLFTLALALRNMAACHHQA